MSYFISSDNLKWYYLLKGKINEQGKHLKGLLDDNPNIESKLVVCAQPKDNERFFCLFDSHLDFITYYKKIENQNKHFYEVIFGNYPQKPHFDLDFEVSEDGTLPLIDGKIISAETILDLVLNSILKCSKSTMSL